MVGTPKQHGLVLQLHAEFSVCEDRVDHEFCLGIAVLDRHVLRPGAGASLGKKILPVLALALGNQAIGGVENRLRRAVILLEGHDACSWHVAVGKPQDVLDLGRAERVDRLGIVAHDGHAAAVGLQRMQNLRLQDVRVLVLVDEDVIEPRADLLRELGFGNEVHPVQQQVIVIERLVLLLAFDVAAKQLGQFLAPVGTPRKSLFDDVGQRLLRVDAA